MANKLYEENDIAAIATAIRAKNGSSDTYTVSQMATAINNIPGGGDVVNGIIESYKAVTSTIDANTFVEFINLIGTDSDTQLSNISNSYGYSSAVLVDTNKVFIAHWSGNYLYGVVCTISGTTIVAGTDTQLSNSSNFYGYSSAVLVDTNKVFIAHSNGNYLYGVVCTISGTTITVGTDTQLSTALDSHYYASAVLLDTNKVFIAHRNSDYLYGMVCTISGTTITVGTDTQLSNGSDSYEYSSAVLVDTNKVFIAHSNSNYLYGVVCTISGTTIVAGTDTQLSNGSYSYIYASAVLVDTNKVFIAHRNNNYLLYGMVCTISGTTITVGTDTQLSNGSNSYEYSSAVLVDTNKVFIAHGRYGSALYGIVCTISGTTIVAGIDAKLSTDFNSHYFTSAVLLDTNKVFIAHENSTSFDASAYLYGMVLSVLDGTCAIESTSKIDGLTKTSCTTTTAGQVWVLNN